MIMEMKSVIDRLNEYYAYKHLTNDELGAVFGCSPKTVANNRSEKRGLKLSTLLVLLEQYKDLSAEWLLRGTGSMITNRQGDMRINVDGNNNITASPNASFIYPTEQQVSSTSKPMILASISNQPNLNIKSEYENRRLDLPLSPMISQFGMYDMTYIVPNDAMSPNYQKGDSIALKLQDGHHIISGNIYALSTERGMFIRYVYESEGSLVCKSCSQHYSDMTIEKSEIYGIYAVIGLLRNFI